MRRKTCIMWQAIFIVAILVGCCTASGCRTSRDTVTTYRTDTVREKETVVEYVPDTVYVEVPAQEKERTTRDSTSYLETDYAESTARINLNGTLFHELRNKPGKKAVETKTKVVTNTIRQQVNHETTRTITIEKRPTWLQRTAVKMFPWLLVLCAGLLLYVLRKPLMIWLRHRPP